MTKINKSFVVLVFFLAAENFAQLADTDTLPLSLNFNQSFYYSSGNVERLLSISQADLVHATENWGFKTSNSFYYGSFAGKKSEDDFYTRNFFYLSPRSAAYPYLMVWYEKNLRQKLNARIQAGAGVSASIFRESHAYIKISLTVTREFNSYSIAGVREEDLLRVTGRIYHTFSLPGSLLQITFESYYQQSILFIDDFRAYTEVICRIPVSETIFLRSSIIHTYDNKVSFSVKKQDLIISAGAGLNLSFWQ